ncbi:MAG: pyruvate:ferredoxin (flavodoxin) oxidoreductase, partial [Chloroflexi bacterium]|nr:pyruvate:ferredoxin (flavodoxin) oxidoreductase [Chloroflexota bacterium]
CVLVCPHAVIRSKIVDQSELAGAPESFKSTANRFKELRDQENLVYTLQVAVEDCTGCAMCVEACPAKNKSEAGRKAINMEEQIPIREQEAANWDFFLDLPEYPRLDGVTFNNVKNTQLLRPLFEFSGACAGCGETPYIGLMTRLFGDRAIIANATGCSSIYGGNLPTHPWAIDDKGRGPTWSNSLFEDNAEFGLGMRIAIDKQAEYARELVASLNEVIDGDLNHRLLTQDQSDEAGIERQRANVEELKAVLANIDNDVANDLGKVADYLVKKSVWIIGGDGWAYDIGYGGLDHVLASGYNVNILVLDTEVYSNTGGQASKATAMGAVAKFAAGGKPTAKKDLGMMAINYGTAYVAQIAMGANDAHTVKAIIEAEAYDGPSMIIAYSHCIAHGIDMSKGLDHQKVAAQTGYWPLFRFDPRLRGEGKNPFQLDSKKPKLKLAEFLYSEARYKILQRSQPEVADTYLAAAQAFVNQRWEQYERLASEWIEPDAE